MSRVVRVKYHIATYSGVVILHVGDEDDNETIIAKARGQLRRACGGAGLPFGSESFEILGDYKEVELEDLD